MATSKWTNLYHTVNGSFTTWATAPRNSVFTYHPNIDVRNAADTGTTTLERYKRLRHIKGSLALDVTTSGGTISAYLMMWKGSDKLSATITADVDLSDTTVFYKVPISATSGNPMRYNFSWPKVSIDTDEKFQIFLHYADSNLVAGVRPDWHYSATFTAMENQRNM